MNIQDRQGLCREAAETLAQTPGHRKLALLWAAVAAGAGLLGSLLSFLLSTRIAETGGLDGMDMRSILSTLQSALSLFTTLALPFWTMGHTAAALEMSRTRQARPGTLPEGFRRFGPVLRFLLLQMLVYMAVAMLSINLSSILITLTPLAAPLTEQLMPTLESYSATGSYVMDQAALEAVEAAMIPVMLFCMVVFCLICIPVSYRLRLAQFRLMDEPGCGALYAMVTSSRMMRHNCLLLFLLDLRFWWFYLAEAAITVLCYGDLLLPWMGITLPMNQDAAYFLFYFLAMAAQVGLYTVAKNRLAVTYAKFYDALQPHA